MQRLSARERAEQDKGSDCGGRGGRQAFCPFAPLAPPAARRSHLTAVSARPAQPDCGGTPELRVGRYAVAPFYTIAGGVSDPRYRVFRQVKIDKSVCRISTPSCRPARCLERYLPILRGHLLHPVLLARHQRVIRRRLAARALEEPAERRRLPAAGVAGPSSCSPGSPLRRNSFGLTLSEHQRVLHPVAGAVELHQPARVDEPVHDGSGHLVVAEHRAPLLDSMFVATMRLWVPSGADMTWKSSLAPSTSSGT